MVAANRLGVHKASRIHTWKSPSGKLKTKLITCWLVRDSEQPYAQHQLGHFPKLTYIVTTI